MTKVDNEFPSLRSSLPDQNNMTKITTQVKKTLLTELYDVHVTYKRCDLERDWVVDIYALRLLNIAVTKSGPCTPQETTADSTQTKKRKV